MTTDNPRYENIKRHLPDFPFDYYWCTGCGYVMAEVEYMGLVCDVGCPRCKMPLWNFEFRPIRCGEERLRG
jgi:hypothetical protein